MFCRKFGIPIPLTKFQELEWHMHRTIFSLWMGYNITINAIGAPTYVLNGETFWGQDRLDLLGDALASRRAPFRP